jgi:D-alanyl-D-alanine carboxypeptidase (penicillin-binding protein 5/6)
MIILCAFLGSIKEASTSRDAPPPNVSPSTAPQALDIKAKWAVLMDAATGDILYEKNPHERMYPSSMIKLMTSYLIFEQMKSGHISKSTLFDVSKKAWKTGGSKMFLEVGKKVSVEDIIKGIIVVSANDGCVCASENICENEEAFVERMNEKAYEMGMFDTHFANSHGLNHGKYFKETATTTVMDMARLCLYVLRDYPQHLIHHSQKEYTFNAIRQLNRNPLLYTSVGCDFGKTGHTERGGFGLAGSCTQKGRRLVFVINGTKSTKERKEEVLKLIHYGYTHYDTVSFFSPLERVMQIPVWMGQDDYVGVCVKDTHFITIKKMALKGFEGTLRFYNHLQAPIQKDQQVGVLEFIHPTTQEKKILPLIAVNDVKKGGFFKRLRHSLGYLFKEKRHVL